MDNFFRVAEEFLCKRAQVSSRSRHSGRGRFPTFVLQPAVGASRPVQHGGAQTTCREGMMRKLARQIDPFLGQLPDQLGVRPHNLHVLLV